MHLLRNKTLLVLGLAALIAVPATILAAAAANENLDYSTITLIRNEGYLADPPKIELVGGAADAVARARKLGFATVVCSNQSGVARGFFGIAREGIAASAGARIVRAAK